MIFIATLLAQVRNPLLGGGLGQGWDYFNTVLPRFINIGYLIAIVVFVFIFIVGSFQWITAGGDKGKLAEARGKITHAIVGLLVLLLIFFITQFVNFVLGINIGMLGTPRGGACQTHCEESGRPYWYCRSNTDPPIDPSICNNDGTVDCSANPPTDCVCCTSPPTLPTSTPPPIGSCTDSDGGQYPYVPGRVIFEGNNYMDSCVEDGGVATVVERYCSGGIVDEVDFLCPYGCTYNPQEEGYCLGSTGAGLLPPSTPTSTPLPTATPRPTSTPTPLPTATPIPTATPRPTATNTPVPTVTPTRIPTATPTRIPTATPTRIPTSTPVPTSTPTPVPTATPSFLPAPTSTPTLTPTPPVVFVPFCSETDGGSNFFNQGVTTDNTSSGNGSVTSLTDFCLSPTRLNEYYCGPTLITASTAYDCNLSPSSPGSKVCNRGECCSQVSSGCITDSDCCSPYLCNSGTCSSSSNIILNEALNTSCQILCEINGYTNVSSMGTDSLGTNGYVYIYTGGSCVLSNIYRSYDGIFDQGGAICGGRRANWTYCRCS